jgi:hypothetical protein
VLLVSVSPHHAAAYLGEDTVLKLPSPWRETIQTDSRWPALFGARFTNDGWRLFVLTPRWSRPRLANLAVTSKGLASLSSLEPLDTSTATFAYTRLWRWWITHPSADMILRGAPSVFFDATSTDPMIEAFAKGSTVSTNLAFGKTMDVSLSKQGDMSFVVPSEKDAPAIANLLNEISFGATRVSDITTKPSAIALTLDGKNRPNRITLNFKTTLEDADQRALLADMGVRESRVIKLPDGGLTTERVLPQSLLKMATSTKVSLGAYMAQEKAVSFCPKTDACNMPEPLPANTLASFSKKGVSLLLKSLGISNTDAFSITSLVFEMQKNQFVIRFEK